MDDKKARYVQVLHAGTPVTRGSTGSVHYAQQGYRQNAAAYAPASNQKPKKSMPYGRKPCNCSKSACLKLYCECFAAGEFCMGCKCKDCHNDLEHEAERSRAIKQCLERNPNAFQPKIVSAQRGRTDVDRTHLKGCHCKKSNCLKNYCECYEAKVPCSTRCKCQGCRNTEADRANRSFGKPNVSANNSISASPYAPNAQQGLMNLAAAAADMQSASTLIDDPDPMLGASSQHHISHLDTSGVADTSFGRHYSQIDKKTQPWYYMNDDVVEATALCLTAQADDVLSKAQHSDDGLGDGDVEERVEQAILREFGRCLNQIISNANAYKANEMLGGGISGNIDVTGITGEHSIDASQHEMAQLVADM